MTKKLFGSGKKNATPGWVFFTGEFSLTTIRLKFHIQIFFSKGLCVWFFSLYYSGIKKGTGSFELQITRRCWYVNEDVFRRN